MTKFIQYLACSVVMLALLYAFRSGLIAMNDSFREGFVLGMIATAIVFVVLEKVSPGAISGRISGSRFRAGEPE
jgi:hypothetical protein